MLQTSEHKCSESACETLVPDTLHAVTSKNVIITSVSTSHHSPQTS